MRLRRALLALVLVPAPLAAQQPAPADLPPAPSYEQAWAEVWGMLPDAEQVAEVHGLTLTRDVGTFVLEGGKILLLSPVGGRRVGLVFVGKGRFRLAPPSRIEQDRLERFRKTRSLDQPFSELFLLFADSTLSELAPKLHFASGDVPSGLKSRVRKYLDFVGDEDSRSFQPDLMAAFLNGDRSDLFYAHINRDDGDPFMFMINPFDFEGVSLGIRRPHSAWSRLEEVICRFPRRNLAWDVDLEGERRGTATIGSYRLETTMAQTGSGGLSFQTRARLRIVAGSPAGPWVAFGLFEKLKIDSATWDSGGLATTFKGKDAGLMWVRLDRRIGPGESRVLQLDYHGDLIDRFVDFFYIKDEIGWYPLPLDGRAYATFDITYHTPSHYLLASVGDLTDSSVSDRVMTTRWVTGAPIRNATFNLGLFEPYRVKQSDTPPITVMVSEEGHRTLSRQLEAQHIELLQQKHMKETVGSDVARSLQFYQKVYGPFPQKQFFAAETPVNYGEAFPGMIDLSWWTFQQTDVRGQDEVFRAHEVAHQWWGIGVDFSTYHDQWMSEGFSDFSGLWYLQTSRKDTEQYFDILNHWRSDIFIRRDEPAPIWLGYRTSSSKDDTGYWTVVYKKGAWVLHMLRILMLDLKSMDEARFTETMQDFYQTYRGKRASTEDFRHMVEKHTGQDMGWFFDQWVYGSEIPTYHVAWKKETTPDHQYRVVLRVRQERVPDDFLAYVPVTVDLGKGGTARVRVKVTGSVTEIPLPPLPVEPRDIKFNDLDGVLADVKTEGW